ncbi:MAG: sensor histidine kinase [Mesorhizobium amorphae]|nr:MAG: sensor histidine kinase [Mesorhizobium amorphae]
MPRSLAGRLLALAACAIAAALLAGGIGMSLVLERFIVRQLDGRLDAQLVLLASVADDGPKAIEKMRRDLDRPPFVRRGGWVWVVEGDDWQVQSRSAGDERLALPEAQSAPRGRGGGGGGPSDRIRSAEGEIEGEGEAHWRVLQLDDVKLAAAAPRDPAITGPLREAMEPLALGLLLLGAALALAALFQVRLGLKPLRAMRAELSEIRAGRRTEVGENQPSEVQPLAVELNSLLRENAEGLARARRHAANLAHGLKTPLATLAAAPALRRDPDAMGLVDGMDRMIRHHLTRARAATLGEGTSRAQVAARARLSELLSVMHAMHRTRPVQGSLTEGQPVAIACEEQDFDEMFGNLLDNAFKWARSKVAVSVVEEGRFASIRIADDGPGLAPDEMPEALRPGRRIDEATPGFGFGLPIARELVELYGGSLALDRSETLGGLSVTVRLPLIP